MIAYSLIFAGLALIGLGIIALRDYRRGAGDFAPIETDGLDESLDLISKIRGFNHRLDLLSYLTLGPASIALGIHDLLK